MSYQVLARKWRPQRFEDVLGQTGVTTTLRNAIASGRIAQAFVFAGARGVGKTTTARILARALNCERGPTPDPCGTCVPCVEIAEGRDIDVLEIDAATHTQVDKVRDIIIEGLAIRPVRNRYKIFIIDEVHQLSSHSFNALLKSIEEPPPHVVFMMATTELGKIPDTILSRAQVYEFRTISTTTIAGQLAAIAQAERIEAEPAALALVARAAEGSMRDAQSALDQVIAFAGGTVTVDDVRTVLGLIGRETLFEIVETVADERAPDVFPLAARVVEAGQDLRSVCRELSRLVRDLMVVSIDPSRAEDPEIAAAGDSERLTALAARFSREDLLRAFDVLAKAETDIRYASQPRHHFEMALLRWIHLGRLVPLTRLIDALREGSPLPATEARPGVPMARRPPAPADPPPPSAAGSGALARRVQSARTGASARPEARRPGEPEAPRAAHREPPPPAPPVASDNPLQAAIVEEIRKRKRFFHGTVVAQADAIELRGDTLTFRFTPAHAALHRQLEQSRGWLETLASEVAGRPVTVVGVREEGGGSASADPEPEASAPADPLRQTALGDEAVQAMLDVFSAEISDVEEIEDPRS